MTDHIIVAGAGLGGLSAALAARRAGYAVTVLERAPHFLASAGAGLTITAPAIASMDALGLEAETLAMSDTAGVTPLIHYATGEVFYTRVVPTPERDEDGPRYFVPRVTHRADMHKLLLDGCIRAGVEVITGAQVVDFTQDANGVTAKLSDGREMAGAILIGADGLRSRIRAILHGDKEPNHTGAVAWRTLIPAPLVADLLGDMTIATHFGPTAHFMQYLVRQRTMLNCVGLIKTDVHAQDGWSTPSTNQELADQLAGWHKGLLDLVARIPEGTLFKWPLLDRDPITEWVDGRVALLGDAAHPMLPYYGIGAAIAMEDGVILERALTTVSDPAEALKVYERARVNRASFAVLESRRLGEVFMGGNVLDVITEPLHDWDIYDYDPRTAALH